MSWVIVVCSVVGAIVGFLSGYTISTKKVKENVQKQLESIKDNLTVADENKDKGVE